MSPRVWKFYYLSLRGVHAWSLRGNIRIGHQKTVVGYQGMVRWL